MPATAKKSSRKSTAKASGGRIRSAYVEHLLEHGKRPASVYKFCTDLGISENEFYDQFGSFDGIERSVWLAFLQDTLDRLNSDKSFGGFSTREKLLAFYYTFFEALKSNRSFVLIQLQSRNRLEIIPEFLKDFRKSFENFIESILKTGKASGEVANRPYLDKTYPELFWMHMGFILLFWRDDSSAGFQKTDAAIEKSVNLAFDLIGKGAVDTALDFAKFLYQTKVN
jgi:hypothetical protein